MSLLEILSVCPRPAGETSDAVKMKITVGFFDTQTGFFQPKIPKDVMERVVSGCASIRGVKRLAPGEMETYRGFLKHVRVHGTPFDLQIEYVRAERQAIFLCEDLILGICHFDYLEKVCESFQTFFEVLKDDVAISFRLL